MYINIDKAKENGLHIGIRHEKGNEKGKGDSFLEIVPMDGISVETLQPLLAELKDQFSFTSAECSEVEDQTSSIIHHLSIWKHLKGLDESKL